MMTQTELMQEIDHCADAWWLRLRKLYPSISAVRPQIKLNKRLKTTAGRAFYAAKPQYVDLSFELVSQYLPNFMVDTIPHELAHLVAWTVYNEPGHGTAWKHVMRSLGLEPTRCHSMFNHLHAARKQGKI
jgi:SprT protein